MYLVNPCIPLLQRHAGSLNFYTCNMLNWHFPSLVAVGSNPTLLLWWCRLIQHDKPRIILANPFSNGLKLSVPCTRSRALPSVRELQTQTS